MEDEGVEGFGYEKLILWTNLKRALDPCEINSKCFINIKDMLNVE